VFKCQIFYIIPRLKAGDFCLFPLHAAGTSGLFLLLICNTVHFAGSAAMIWPDFQSLRNTKSVSVAKKDYTFCLYSLIRDVVLQHDQIKKGRLQPNAEVFLFSWG
jgi:hypothetical protein